MQQLISERYTDVQQLLSQHHEELERVAHALLERESLDEQQLQRLVKDSNTNAQLVRDVPERELSETR